MLLIGNQSRLPAVGVEEEDDDEEEEDDDDFRLQASVHNNAASPRDPHIRGAVEL